MQIAILSDTHSRYATVEKALELLQGRKVNVVLHCGDIESPDTVRLFKPVPTHFVFGNWDRDRLKLVAAVKETAAQLGNTPAVCKSSYIWPSVLHSFEKGTVLKTYFKTMKELIESRSHGAERALLDLLKMGRSTVAEPPKRTRETKMSRRMRRSPRARRLAKAFSLH